jgi:hypothetical protein
MAETSIGALSPWKARVLLLEVVMDDIGGATFSPSLTPFS